MTMGQFALRLGVSKLRAVELERAKVDGSAPLKI
jgi:hypothetical protein